MNVEDILDAAKAGDAARVRDILAADASLAGARNAAGETPLMAALYRGHAPLADEITDALERIGRPLDVFAAAALGKPEALDAAVMRDAGAVNSHAYDGWTPLHLAVFFGHAEAAERLLAAGASLGAVSSNSLRNTPLHAAVAGGHVNAALLLIEAGAAVNVTDAGGHTPLHIAAEAGYLPVVEALLARGADPHVVDAEDKTPLSRAAARKHTGVVDMINVQKTGR